MAYPSVTDMVPRPDPKRWATINSYLVFDGSGNQLLAPFCPNFAMIRASTYADYRAKRDEEHGCLLKIGRRHG